MPVRESLGPRALRRLPAVALVAAVAMRAGAQPAARLQESSFAAAVARLSESGGFFDTDNLISNEASYLHAVSRLRELGTTGGAYIGVGPDQNFSYIAAIRPRIAYILDIRRDNLIQHLMFKALFEQSRNRMDYLCRWLGRSPPADLAAWDRRSISDIVEWIGARPPNDAYTRSEQSALVEQAGRSGIPLSAQDVATLRRFHEEFVKEGLELRFTSFNRGARSYYPTLGQLILEKNLDGKMVSYLADEDDWRFVRSLESSDRIIPVVGNLAGPHALAAIGREVAARGERISAIYTSNVEQYIWRDGSFPHFAEMVAKLPRDAHSAIVRSYFGAGYGGERHPQAREGYYSTQLVQTLNDFAARQKDGGWTSYWELVTAGNKD